MGGVGVVRRRDEQHVKKKEETDTQTNLHFAD